MCTKLCNVEPDHCVCDDTSRGWRSYWRTELEGVKHVEQEEEQHVEQGGEEYVEGEH